MKNIALHSLSFFFKNFSLIPHQNNKEQINCYFFPYRLHLSIANIFTVQKIYIDSGTSIRKQDYLTLQILKSHCRRFSCVYSKFGTCNKMYKPIQNNSIMISHQNIQSCAFSLNSKHTVRYLNPDTMTFSYVHIATKKQKGTGFLHCTDHLCLSALIRM